jgi:pilus assembly protein CpaB
MRSGRVLLIVGVVLLIAVLIGGFFVWQRTQQGPGVPASSGAAGEGTPVPYVPPESKEVVVAAQDIPRGTLITLDSGAVTTASWPQDSMAAELAMTELDETNGRIARVDIVRGSPILEKMLSAEPGELGATGSDAALRIPTGRVAYALPVSRYSAVAWALQPGDHVDVIISLLMVDLDEEYQTLLPNDTVCVSPTEEDGCSGGPMGRLETLPNGWIVKTIPGEEQRPRLVTNLTVQNAEVLRVGDWMPDEEAVPEGTTEEKTEEADQPTPAVSRSPEVRPLTLAVTPQDAMTLKYAQEIGANVDLVLRSVGDATTSFQTESVTLEYLFEHFAIEQPPKLPYGVTPPLDALEPGSAEVEGEGPGEAGGGEARE